MTLIRFFLIVLALVFASGCTAIRVQPIDTRLKIKHVCIKDCADECFVEHMMDVIRDGFARHGITTSIYSSDLPTECEDHLSYYCELSWDFSTFMAHAELRLYRGTAQIGYAEYDLTADGGFSLMKWQSTKTKMDPVIDELLNGQPVQRQSQ